jgi:phosphoglycerate dehydrogenase-like enzyme
LRPLEATPSVECRLLEVPDGELTAAALAGLDALIIASSRFRVSRDTVERTDHLALIARLGAGYETIDLDACTEAGVAVTTAPEAVRRTMATTAIAFVLALMLKITQKERSLREGRSAEGASDLGLGLGGRTLGIVGLGNIGAEIARLAAPFSPRLLACDPTPSAPTDLDPPLELSGLEELLERSDVVVVSCPLNDSTWRLLDRRRLALMKPTAFVVNIARGPILDQEGLVEMLDSGRLAGAAPDVFEDEPVAIPPPSPAPQRHRHAARDRLDRRGLPHRRSGGLRGRARRGRRCRPRRCREPRGARTRQLPGQAR